MRKSYFILLLTLICLSCGKIDNPVPDVGVNFQGSLFSPALSKLRGYGVAITIDGYGVAGLILYHQLNGVYSAYDRCSTYLPEKKCAVNIDSGNFTATDPCSGEIYSLTDGTPQKGPAKYALKAYYVSVANDVITVSN